jgi:hypothetical protein
MATPTEIIRQIDGIETVDEFREYLADAFGIYGSPEKDDHPEDCGCRICFTIAVANCVERISDTDGRLKVAVEALREITRREGRFSTDLLEHASNAVEDMAKKAIAALDELDEGYYLVKDGFYYRADSRGYTDNVEKAGIFSKEEAIREEQSCHGEVKKIKLRL